MDLMILARAYVDLVVTVTEDELAAHGFDAGRIAYIERDRMQKMVKEYLHRGAIIPGGSGANSLSMLVDMGGEGGLIGKVGADELGKVFVEDFKQRGAAFDYCDTEKEGTACCIVFVTPDGERTLGYNPGLSDEVTVQDVEINRERLEQAAFVCTELTYLEDACKDVVALMRDYASDAGYVVHLQMYQPGRPDLAQRVLEADIVTGNEHEIDDFCADLGIKDILELAKRYPGKIFARTRGSLGAVIYKGTETFDIPALWVEERVDTNGAGDVWFAGFLYGLSRYLSLEESGFMGALCAAQILQVKGGRWPLERPLCLDQCSGVTLDISQREFAEKILEKCQQASAEKSLP